MRIGIEAAFGRGDLHLLEQFERAGMGLFRRHILVAQNRFGDLLAQRIDRIERQHRLLKDHRNRAPAHIPDFGFRQCHNVMAINNDASFDLRCLFGMQAQQRAQSDAFARARFTEQHQHRAFFHLQRHMVDSAHGFAASGECDSQPFDGNQIAHALASGINMLSMSCTGNNSFAACVWPDCGTSARQAA